MTPEGLKKIPFEQKIERGSDRVFVTVETPEEGIKLIKDFWSKMPHGRDLTLPKYTDPIDYWRELTMGDRTNLMKRSGVWRVGFMPNTDNVLSNEAMEWLQQKGFM
jgi:hypothetical protein